MNKKRNNKEDLCEKEMLQRILQIVEGTERQGLHNPLGKRASMTTRA